MANQTDRDRSGPGVGPPAEPSVQKQKKPLGEWEVERKDEPWQAPDRVPEEGTQPNGGEQDAEQETDDGQQRERNNP